MSSYRMSKDLLQFEADRYFEAQDILTTLRNAGIAASEIPLLIEMRKVKAITDLILLVGNLHNDMVSLPIKDLRILCSEILLSVRREETAG